MMCPMTAEELRAAERRYYKAARLAQEAREARDAAVRQAIREGWTHRRIAQATGLTHGRIGQIASSSR
jgi:hypothetical protein